MTTAFVVRLNEKQTAGLESTARKRSTTRSAIMRAALDKYLAENPAPTKGVGWAEHFKWLKKHGKVIKGHPDDEIREIDRNRWK